MFDSAFILLRFYLESMNRDELFASQVLMCGNGYETGELKHARLNMGPGDDQIRGNATGVDPVCISQDMLNSRIKSDLTYRK